MSIPDDASFEPEQLLVEATATASSPGRQEISWHATEQLLVEAAKVLAVVRPLEPYPGWRFDIEWDNPDPAFRIRREIWSYFRERIPQTPIPTRWHYGLIFNLWLGNDLTKQLFFGGCNEPNEMALVNRVLKPGMIFVDAGANDGLYTLLASRLVGDQGRVYAFEPSRREFERLKENVRLNQIRNVRAIPVALADYNGEGELVVADYEHSGQNTLGSLACQIPSLGKERVAIRKLDDVVSEQRLKRLDLMKLDVEGAEVRLTEGALKVMHNLRPIVLFEMSESSLVAQQSSSTQLLDLFRSFHYDIYAFDEKTGWPVKATEGQVSNNMVAVPSGTSLPAPL